MAPSASTQASRIEARRHLERALAIGGVDARTCDNLGIACWESGDQDAALAAFEQAVAADPTLTPALANLVHTRRYLCEWDGLDAIEGKLTATLDAPGADPRWSPYVALSCCADPGAAARGGEALVERRAAGSGCAATREARAANGCASAICRATFASIRRGA